MITFSIPGIGNIEIRNVVFDLNGTLSMSGNIASEVQEKIHQLSKKVEIFLLSSDTRGNLREIAEKLGVNWHRVSASSLSENVVKENFVEKLGAENTIAVGNGKNDELMLKKAKIGIAVIGEEGASPSTILNADIIVTNPVHALELILDPQKIIATMRY
ncbi:MAG: HAD hydrolase family protein [Candidatus Jordarchaeaceae archaeon]